MFDFLQSRTFVTHITGLLSIIGAAWVIPNTPIISLAIAILTGITEAAHAYQNVRLQPTLTSADLKEAITPDAISGGPSA